MDTQAHQAKWLHLCKFEVKVYCVFSVPGLRQEDQSKDRSRSSKSLKSSWGDGLLVKHQRTDEAMNRPGVEQLLGCQGSQVLETWDVSAAQRARQRRKGSHAMQQARTEACCALAPPSVSGPCWKEGTARGSRTAA